MTLAGQIDGEYRTFPGLAGDPDRPAAPRDDAVDRREAEAGALPARLGREERLEQVGLRLVGHARAGIADGQRDAIPALRRRLGSAPGPLPELDGRWCDPGPAASSGCSR